MRPNADTPSLAREVSSLRYTLRHWWTFIMKMRMRIEEILT
jgi:hypothetical protein